MSAMLTTRRQDRIFDTLLSREAIEDADFAGLSEVVAIISLDSDTAPTDGEVAEFAQIAARMARSEKSESTQRIRTGYRPLIPRLATAALAVVLVIGMTGVAVAADAARPGQALYGIDRALERIGINDGGLGERVEEANQLVVTGSPSEALDHLADSLVTMSAGAADALQRAAVNVRDGGNDNPSQHVREDVASMLEWMSISDVSRREFGEELSQRARNIGQSPSEPAGKPDSPSEPNPGRDNGQGGGNGQGPPGGPPSGQGGTPPGQESPPPGPRGP